MAGWYSVICKNCSAEFAAHEDWQNVSAYCKDCTWHELPCEICKNPMRVRRDWAHPPRAHKECKEAAAAKWIEKPCKRCKAPMRVNKDWHHPPALCKTCKEIEELRWSEKPCKRCGVTMRINQDWRTPPVYCKACKEIEDAKWYEVACKECGQPMRLNKDWKNPPKFHEGCTWYERACSICNEPMRINRGWNRAPKSHKECLAEFAPKEFTCPSCEKPFVVTTPTQLRCREKGWELPKRCDPCKQDFLRVRGAVNALRAQLGGNVEGKIVEAGQLFEERVVLLLHRKSGASLAEARVAPNGTLLEHRVFPGVAVSEPSAADTHVPSGDEELANEGAVAASMDDEVAETEALAAEAEIEAELELTTDPVLVEDSEQAELTGWENAVDPGVLPEFAAGGPEENGTVPELVSTAEPELETAGVAG